MLSNLEKKSDTVYLINTVILIHLIYIIVIIIYFQLMLRIKYNY
jgi:hypothetical protein